jgi:hypothetical protein
MGMWAAYQAFFDGGIPYAAEISSIFIVGLCIFGLVKAYQIFKEM